jgi:hydrogenase maturation factor
VSGPVFLGPVFPGAASVGPLSGPAPRFTDAGYGVCSADADCITCGDVAVPLTVVSATAGGTDALCRDDLGREEAVATDFVGPVEAGDRVLVHAGVAIEVLGRAADSAASGTATESLAASGTAKPEPPASEAAAAPEPAAPNPPQEPTGDRDALRR